VIVRFVDICGIIDHRCLEVIVRFADIDGIVDQHCSFHNMFDSIINEELWVIFYHKSCC
jgi:hypothetical protein